MKRVIFYFEPDWAFGSIHYELCKYLFAKGINAQLLPWDKNYMPQEFDELDETKDLYFTNPQGYQVLKDGYHIDPEKVVVVAHAIGDLHTLINEPVTDEYEEPKVFAVVSELLKEKAAELGIKRMPIVLPLGVNTNIYDFEPSHSLKVVGFAGAYKGFHQEIKRGQLAEEVVNQAGLEFRIAQSYHNSYVTMPGFYKDVDCIIVSSTEEGAGLPALEAGAAGKLVISTPVGHWLERCQPGGGHTVPIDAAEFRSHVVKLLKEYENDPEKYRAKCRSIQRFARKNYDWNIVVDEWVKVINGAQNSPFIEE